MTTEADQPLPPPDAAGPASEAEWNERFLKDLPIIRADLERRSMRFQSGESGCALYGDRLVLFRKRRWSWIFANIVLATLLLSPVIIFVFGFVIVLLARVLG